MSERLRHAEATGARAVAMAKEKLTPDKIMTPDAFENALRVLLAIGGSTNAHRASGGDGRAARHRASISMRSTAWAARRRCWSI